MQENQTKENKEQPKEKAISANRTMYSIPEIMEMSGLGRTKIYQEISDGYLRAKKIGARTVIPIEAYTDWVNNLPDYLENQNK